MFTIIITTKIHDINNIITYVAKTKEDILHNISVTVFLLFLFFITVLIIPIIGQFTAQKNFNGLKNSTVECGEKSSYNKRNPISSKILSYSILFLIFLSQLFLLFPFALAFEKLTFYVFIQGLIFFAIIVLSLSYAVQKNMLRFK